MASALLSVAFLLISAVNGATLPNRTATFSGLSRPCRINVCYAIDNGSDMSAETFNEQIDFVLLSVASTSIDPAIKNAAYSYGAGAGVRQVEGLTLDVEKLLLSVQDIPQGPETATSDIERRCLKQMLEGRERTRSIFAQGPDAAQALLNGTTPTPPLDPACLRFRRLQRSRPTGLPKAINGCTRALLSQRANANVLVVTGGGATSLTEQVSSITAARASAAAGVSFIAVPASSASELFFRRLVGRSGTVTGGIQEPLAFLDIFSETIDSICT